MARTRATFKSLAELFADTTRPVYAIDGRRQIVFCNAALAEWLELDADRILGRFVEYHSEPTPSGSAKTDGPAPLTDLCPPPRALAGEPCTGTLSCAVREGRLAHRLAEFIPLPPKPSRGGRTPSGCGVFAVLGDRDLSAEELAASPDPLTDELHRTIRRFRRAQAARYSLDSLLGGSRPMQKLRAQVAAASISGANALVRGAPGSGRTQVARAIHYHAATDPPAKLIPFDCELASDDSLRRALDSLELPSDDPRQRPTLLLENLDRLAPAHQALLLDAVRHSAFRSRVVATCSREALPAGAHAAENEETPSAGDETAPDGSRSTPWSAEPELLDFISTITIDVPRLRERLEDLPIIAQCFLEACNRGGTQVGSVREDALERLALYPWPGELAELRETIFAAHEACDSHEITPRDLPPVVHHALQAALRRRPAPGRIRLDSLLEKIEREAIERALAQAAGNKTEAAELLGMTRPRLYRRLIQLGLASEAKDDGQAPEFIEQPPNDETP